MSNSRVDSGAFCEICIKCKERLPGNQWCQQCESTYFKGAFKSWTSGNHELDKFIRKTQLKAIDRADYLEWIPYERIEDIKFIAYGAYGRPYTKASDIYSTGVLMWVISSGKQPFANRGHDFQLQIDICNGIRPDITPDTPQFYQELMESCWNQDPKQRPTIQTIQLDLKDFIKGSGGARKQIEEAEKIRLELQSEQFIITSPPDTHKAYYTTREIK
ncbi:17859_t:CDS:2, partial [Racocetra fulgida]